MSSSTRFLQVQISAETKQQADDILNALLSKKLVTGGQLVSAPARFLWKGEVTDMDYFAINSFTIAKHKQAIIDIVKKISVEEVPMVSFVVIDGNEELLTWIRKTVAQ